MGKDLINIGIVDDHLLIRKCIIDTLSKIEGFVFTFEASNGEEMLNSLRSPLPDVMLLDIKMPKLDGISSLRQIQKKFPSIKILILSAFIDELYVAQCLDCGVNGYLTKSMSVKEIEKAIFAASKNEIYVNNLMQNTLLRKYMQNHNKNSSYTLPSFTSQEMEIIEMLSLEMTTDEISDKLCMSKRSIEIKREKIKEKAKVKTIGGLLVYCIKRGLI